MEFNYINELKKSKYKDIKYIKCIIKEKNILNNTEVLYTVKDKSGILDLKSNEFNLKINDVIKFKVNYDGENFRALNFEEILNFKIEDFLPTVNKDINQMFKELEDISKIEFKSKEVIELDKFFFSQQIFVEKFKKAIAGVAEHHAYIGGLLEHTLNVVYLTRILCYRYNCFHKEIAILAAKLHDIGKIYEYNYKNNFYTTLRGAMEGHIVIGITMLEEAFKANPNLYSEDFKTRIKGCIVQHHGKVQYGSPKSPNTEEAFIIHYADYIDATMNKIEDVKKDISLGQWSKYDKRLETNIFF